MIIVKPEDLIARIKKGDELVFEQVYREYYTRLYAYVFGYIKEKEDTKEIIQNTFMVLWDKRAELDDDLKIYAWLFAVVKNACLNHLRNKMNRIQFHDQMELHESERLQWETYTLQSFIPEEVTLSEIHQLVNEASTQMPEQCRQVFLMSRYEGLSHKEISEKLTISTKTVETQITRALKIVRKKLSDYHFFLFLILF